MSKKKAEKQHKVVNGDASIESSDKSFGTSDAEKEKFRLRPQVERLTRELVHVTRQLEQCEMEYGEIRRQKSELQESYDTLQGEKQHLEKEIEKLRVEIETIKKENELQLIESQKLKQDNTILERSLEEAKQIAAGHFRLTRMWESTRAAEQERLIMEDREARYMSSITSLESLHIKKCIGKSMTKPTGRYGCNSIVYRVKRTETSKGSMSYAMKAVLNPYSTAFNESQGTCMSDEFIDSRFRLEYDLPCQPHRNVIRVLHHFCSEVQREDLPEWPPEGGSKALFVLMKEYDDNLQAYCRSLRERGLMSSRMLLSLLVQLLAGIEHLGKHNILHRDLKLDNVLVSLEGDNARLVICDFGCIYHAPGKLQKVRTKSLCDSGGGNVSHFPPELSALPEDPGVARDVSKADVWAVGMMGYEMVTGHDASKIIPADHKKRRKSYSIPSLPPEYSIPIHCRKLLESLLQFDVNKRPNASEAVVMCCILLYGPCIPEDGTIDKDYIERWHHEKLMTLSDNNSDPILLNYLHLYSPLQVTSLISKYLVHKSS